MNYSTQNLTDIKKTLRDLNDYAQLEALGKKLTLSHILEIFTIKFFEKYDSWKLAPLFVGMPHQLFIDFIQNATSKNMELLYFEASIEPVQHHLTLLAHELNFQIPLYIEQLINLEKTIVQLDVKDLSTNDVDAFYHQIHQFANRYEEDLDKINKTLSLAWKTHRTDLIEKLGATKEMSLKYFGLILGSPGTNNTQPTGLYAKLEEHLNSVFGNPNDPHDIEAVSNDEPSLEALAKLSVWYLKDYRKIGLLPEIQEIDQLEREDLKEILIQKVRENLEKIGLRTVGDLKKAKIFSKKSLQEYITHHRFLF